MDYRNKPVLTTSNVIAFVELIFGFGGAFIWGTGVILSLTGYNGLDFSTMLLSLAMFVPNVLLLYAGVRRLKYSGRANRYNSLLQADADGARLVKDLASDLGCTEETVVKELEWLLHRRFLKDCTLERGAMPAVYMKKNTAAWVPEKKTVRCKNCGAFVEIRTGGTGRCEYCDAPLKDNE